MPHICRTFIGLGLALLLGSAAWILPLFPTTTARSAAPSTSEAHPYGDPVWFPLRTPATIGCAKSGCHTSADHGYFAIDFLGAEGDPVFAAGAGIVHVGANSGSCGVSSEVEGRWVWIDHGGGVVSRYHHLASIAVREGQLVTPATRLGGMGHSGDVAPCRQSYLHFEVREDGVHGGRIDFGQLRACSKGNALTLPAALGYASWNDPDLHPVRRLKTPPTDSSCVRPDWLGTLPRTQPVVSRSPGAVQVRLVAPAGASTWLAQLQIWRPSLGEWRELDHRQVSGTTDQTAFTGLEDTRRYRVRTGTHTPAGWSAWSTITEAKGAPGAPDSPRYLTWRHKSSSKTSYLHYGWERPANLGSDVTSFTVARRCGASTASLGVWKTSTQKQKDTYRNIRGLAKAKVCEVKVRATNDVGTGPWSEVTRIRR